MPSVSPVWCCVPYSSIVEDVDAYLLDAVRTPFGRHRGGLAGIRTDDLAALPIIELLRRHPALAEPDRVDDVILGDTNGAGEDNRNVARMAVLLAGLPTTRPRRDRQPALRLGRRGDRPGGAGRSRPATPT